MIFFQVHLHSNSIIEDPTFEKTLPQFAARFPSICLKVIRFCLSVVEGIIGDEAEALLKNKVVYPSKEFNAEIIKVINRLQDGSYSKKTDGSSYYRYLPFFLSGDSQQLAEGFSHLFYSPEENEAWARQAPDIAILMQYVIKLKKEAMERYIRGERSPTPKEIALRKANREWGSFYQQAGAKASRVQFSEDMLSQNRGSLIPND